MRRSHVIQQASAEGVLVEKVVTQRIADGTAFQVHFRFALSATTKDEAKAVAAGYLAKEYGVADFDFYTNPRMGRGSFFAVFVTDWR